MGSRNVRSVSMQFIRMSAGAAGQSVYCRDRLYQRDVETRVVYLGARDLSDQWKTHAHRPANGVCFRVCIDRLHPSPIPDIGRIGLVTSPHILYLDYFRYLQYAFTPAQTSEAPFGVELAPNNNIRSTPLFSAAVSRKHRFRHITIDAPSLVFPIGSEIRVFEVVEVFPSEDRVLRWRACPTRSGNKS